MNILDRLCAIDGISSVGVCEFQVLCRWMNEEQIQSASKLCPNGNSVFVALFPYFNGIRAGNLSLYARGTDYHIVIPQLLTPFLTEFSNQTGYHGVILTDDSPLPEVQAARLSGVGKMGENGLIFDPIYGSYVFIGTILTDYPFVMQPAIHADGTHTIPPSMDSPQVDCLRCGACRKQCPGQAIAPDGTIDLDCCVSELTQRNIELTPEQQELVRRHSLIWGCDQCQTLCPQNRQVQYSDNSAFTQNTLDFLDIKQLDGLTRKQFCAAFADRAFTWRGPKPLIRNLMLKGTK